MTSDTCGKLTCLYIHILVNLSACAAGARHLEESSVATELARIEKTGDAISSKASFFFGASCSDMGHLLANPSVTQLTK